MNQTTSELRGAAHDRPDAAVAPPAMFVGVSHRVHCPARRPITHDGGAGRVRGINPTNAQDLLADLARVDVDDLRHHHVELVGAVAELARAAGLDWPWTHDDSTIAVLRALSKIALIAPAATSPRAAAIRRRLAKPGGVVWSEADDVPHRRASAESLTGSRR